MLAGHEDAGEPLEVNVAGLLDPIAVGELKLPNRVWMAPLTRLRGTVDHLPTPVMAEYYRQRASAGLILSEGTPVSPMGVGYPQVPGIWSAEQVARWRPVTQAVHEEGGRIFAQIWHVGRISAPVFLGGRLPVSSTAVAAKGNLSVLRPLTPYPVPHALTIPEIAEVVEEFRRGAQNAQAAGFDGVEIHGANGYLIDQFLQDGPNGRTDEYGGPIENRARFMLEVLDAAVSVWGPGRVGMHLAPRGDAQSAGDSDPAATFEYVAREMGKRKIAFLAAREYEGPDSLGPRLKEAFGGVFVANEKFTQAEGDKVIAEGKADAVLFGKLFIANPDLPLRFASGAELNRPDPQTFYTHGEEGYIDYPAMARQAVAIG